MEILAAVVCICVVELVVLVFALRSVERADERRARAELERADSAARSMPRFLGDHALPVPGHASLEGLLMQLERHVQAEQQAAESFLRNPTAESLHLRAPSPFHVTH